MDKAVSISGSRYTVRGTVRNKANGEGLVDLHVLVYDKDLVEVNDFLGIGVTDAEGRFSVSFDESQFSFLSTFDKSPDLFFIVKNAGLELLSTKNNVLSNADESTPAINLEVDISNDKLRAAVKKTPVGGWAGTFSKSNPDFAYPNPDLSSLGPLKDNMDNIDKLKRQQKILWPEFSWETKPGTDDPRRCYRMFAPDISRLGYNDDGRIYSIICPQEGFTSPHLGALNVEVTVKGTRGWVNEDKEGDATTQGLAADLRVVGKIWFSPSACKNKIVKRIWDHFEKKGLPFPFNKANAIEVQTFKPGLPDQLTFSLTNGPSSRFEIPNFANHEGIAWRLGHIDVEVGDIKKENVEIVDKFNQLVMDIFNLVSGNMLKPQNILTWNLWFTAPELVDQEEWRNHAELWRESIEADYGTPSGFGSGARYFDGTPFEPLDSLLEGDSPDILAFIRDYLSE